MFELRFNNSGHFAFLVGTYITKCSPLLADFKCSGVEKFKCSVVQAANDCGFWVIFWMVLLAYGLGRYAEYGDPTTFDEYRKRVQCDLRRKSLFYCVPFQTVRQIQFSRPPLLVLNLKTPGGGLGGLRRALERTALLDWQGGEYELVAVLNHVMEETHYTACVRYDQSWFKCDDFPLAVAKVSPPIAADTDYILFYVLTSGSANSFGTSALLSPSRISVGVGSACMSSPVSTPVRPAAFTPDSAPRARSFNRPTVDSRLLTPFSSVNFSHLTAPRLLRNIGNSCFFNSIIQCLIACSRVAPNRVHFRGLLFDFMSAYASEVDLQEEQLINALYEDATKRTPDDAHLLKPRTSGKPGLSMHDAHHFLQMLLVGDSPLVDNTSFSIESNSVVRCSCGAMGSKPCVSDICLFVNVDGPTLAGQLDKLLLEEPVVYACDQLGDKSK